MSILEILILIGLSGLAGLPGAGRLRISLLLALSVGVIFWLQPPLPIRNLDFFLPLATLMLAAAGWVVTASPQARSLRACLPAFGITAGVVLTLAAARYLGMDSLILPSRPPRFEWVVYAFVLVGALLFGLRRLSSPRLVWAVLVLLLTLLIVVKTPIFSRQASEGLRFLGGQSTSQASPLDIRWLGFSYVVFRLIHTLRDRQMGRLPDATLSEYMVYVIFFPAFTAGPIDRLERFISDLRTPLPLGPPDQLEALQRLLLGLFKKFVIADTLSIFALNDRLAGEVTAPGWMWLVVYAFALQIYFDFSGYTDLAIGTARLVGIRLPENFITPYTKPNLTQFWNAWHITLTQWFRAYFFNPLTRGMRAARHPLPAWAVILISQVATMLLIGLWHGVSWNFVLWGAWHGLGLFAHNRWSDLVRARAAAWAVTPIRQMLLAVSGAAITFQFVALGWVFFALSSPGLSWQVFQTLLGRR